jgi:hypothetical protein
LAKLCAIALAKKQAETMALEEKRLHLAPV